MFRNILFSLSLVISVQAQLNGEFWWLNSKLNNLRNVRPSPPKIEINDFQNDESSKVIFRDDDWFSNKILKPINDRTSKLKGMENSDENKVVWPTGGHMKNHDVEVFNNKINIVKQFDEVTKPSKIRNNYDDIIVFDYHKNDKFITADSNKAKTKNIYSTSTQSVTDKTLNPISDQTSKLKVIVNSDENKVAWPAGKHMKNHNVEVLTDKNNLIKTDDVTKPSKYQNKYEDSLVFSYPNKDKLLSVDLNKVSTESFISTSSQIKLEPESDNTNIEVLLSVDKLSENTVNHKESQNICTYTEKEKCNKLNGFVYVYTRRIPTTSSGEPLVCCILPIQPVFNKANLSESISFLRTSGKLTRYKRSDNQENVALKQRDFLLKHKFSTQRQSVKPASTPFTKIVTSPEDDYADPYWNIKNNNFQSPTKLKIENTKYDYDSEDYEQEYRDELPKPGLVGLYSDHAISPSRWHFAGGSTGISYGGSDDDYEESDEYDDDDTFGYSTIDPRQGTKIQKHKRKPVKLTTASDEITYDAESHTVNFQSNPDFHVFQGFKLLNLYRNTTRVNNKNTIKTSKKNLSKEVLVSSVENSGEEVAEFFDEQQLFEGCGEVAAKIGDNGNRIGKAEIGSHPWLALVVLTKTRHNVLCYATLVHPRAAVTVGDCVQGTAPGDLTVIAGLWDLADRSQSRNRVASVHVHPRYKPGNVENNLAVLYWMRPLKLNINIQPACLGEPKIDEECNFFGWGGLGQGIQQQHSRWQRATVKTCSSRPGVKRTRSSVEAFCVSTPRGTVTGMGGPLICDVGGHSSIVGVLVSRDNGYVLSPVQDWTMKIEKLISGD